VGVYDVVLKVFSVLVAFTALLSSALFPYYGSVYGRSEHNLMTSVGMWLEVIKLANTHPRVNIHLPVLGVGGPCLPKDPCFLIYKLKLPRPNLITTARRINDHMPNHIIEITLKALGETGKNI